MTHTAQSWTPLDDSSEKSLRAVIFAALPRDAAEGLARRLSVSGQLWTELTRAGASPSVGLLAAQAVPVAPGPVTRADGEGAERVEALLRSCHKTLSQSHISFASQSDAAYVTTVIRFADGYGREQADYLLALAQRLARSESHWFRFSAISFIHDVSAEERIRYRDVFQCPVLFGQSQFAVRVAVRHARAPRMAHGTMTTSAQPVAHGDGEDNVEQRQSETLVPCGIPPRAPIELLERVYDDAVRTGCFDTAAIAAKHKISVRALRKRLAARGTSHRKQMDRARSIVARAALRNTEASLEEIAERIGYGDITAFVRAFRRWNGTTPGAFRRMSRQSPLHYPQVHPY